MTLTLQREYAQARKAGYSARESLRTARILREWDNLESAGLVRLRAEGEQEGYFDVYGEPVSAKERAEIERYLDLWGCYCCLAEYLDTRGTWQVADSIGMCVYANPLDPLENWYIPDLMQSAIDSANAVHFQRAGSGI